MDDTIKVIYTTKGKTGISYKGNFFYHNRTGTHKIFWLCSKHQSKKCNARLHTNDSTTNPQLIDEVGTHTHGPDAVDCEKRETMANIRSDAITTSSSPAIIIAQNVRQVSSATQGALPQIDSIKRTVRQARSVEGGSLAVPHRREDIKLPEKFKRTNAGQDFLLFDSGTDNSRILVFTTHENLNFLKHSDVWLVDGTFKVAPVLFNQMFVIHSQRNGTTFPLVYCLTPNRTTETYKRILDALINLCPGLAPTTIMSDFEMASINAFESNFPEAEKKGCFFHFNQCIFRQIQNNPDILHMYNTDSNFSLMLRHLVALAFLPPEDVVATFEHLIEDPFFEINEGLLVDLITYFERTWIGAWNRRKTSRLSPLFSIPLWNCFHSVLEDLPKTNNSCEGFHHGFASLLGASHPTIYKLINGLQEQQTLTEFKINQFRAGTIPPSKRKYMDAAKRLKVIVEKYGADDFTQIEYLRRLAYCITI